VNCVRFGTSTITAFAPTNKLTAKVATLQFDVGASALGPSAIVLLGKTKITADPPLLGGNAILAPNSNVFGTPSAAGNALVMPSAADNALVTPDGGRGASYAPAMNASFTALPMLSIPGANIARGTDTVPSVVPSDDDLQPIVYAPPAV